MTPPSGPSAAAALGIGVVTARDPASRPRSSTTREPPAVLFVRGDLAVLDARRVGVVGTRNATRPGARRRAELGHELAAAGVAVVSGLAKGIDGAAHRGALRGRRRAARSRWSATAPTAVPTQHAALWDEVCGAGLLLSEWPPGTAPEPFRFPLRNRILAALSEVLVVVESRERGGSLITAQAALERSVDVMAVPGSVRNRAAAGTNQLLRDGAAPVTVVDDVLVALGLDTAAPGHAGFDPRPLPRGIDADVLERCRQDPCTLDDDRRPSSVSPLTDAAMTLARLERPGWVREAGGWFEAVRVMAGRA